MTYPDSGSPFEDFNILKNAVNFSTASRAYAAELILKQIIDKGHQENAFLVLKAFEEFMTATEDMLGWLFTLEKWQPGKAEFSLHSFRSNPSWEKT